jgi:hypothetical protein
VTVQSLGGGGGSGGGLNVTGDTCVINTGGAGSSAGRGGSRSVSAASAVAGGDAGDVKTVINNGVESSDRADGRLVEAGDQRIRRR